MHRTARRWDATEDCPEVTKDEGNKEWIRKEARRVEAAKDGRSTGMRTTQLSLSQLRTVQRGPEDLKGKLDASQSPDAKAKFKSIHQAPPGLREKLTPATLRAGEFLPHQCHHVTLGWSGSQAGNQKSVGSSESSLGISHGEFQRFANQHGLAATKFR
ncbi:unnamed protein product [Pedinophyceae sp. YPF-701]|nr:unnamed protein product [Pedinophyceae sp. YPF-701]